MPRLPRFPFFPHLAVIATLALCGWLASDSAAGPYLNSAHGNATTGVDRDSLPITYSTGNCAHCHEQHASIGPGVGEPAPVTGPSDFLLLDNLAGNAACNYCHDGSTGANNNIASQILKASSHDPNYGTGAALCNDCHDSHVAQKVNHDDLPFTPSNVVAANSPLLSVKGTSVSSWTAGLPAPGAENLGTLGLNALAEPITYEYELCFRCHAVLPPIAANLDVGLQFNPNNYSVHPVATEANPTWTNGWLAVPQVPSPLNATWTANLNADMYCSDCHGSETGTDPKGPHGSTNPYLLKLSGPGPSLDNLCLSCHNPLVSSAWVDPGNPQPALIGDHTLPAHLQGPGNPDGCLACHGGIANPLLASSIHGANYQWPAFGGFQGVPSRFFLLPYVGANPFAPLAYITGNTFNPVDARGTRICTSPCHVAPGGPGYLY